MASISQWVQGSRPRTWPAAFAPVAAGTGAAIHQIGFEPGTVVPRALLALGVALALQIGVNYANDYSDGIRGTDDDRVGPFRLTGSRAARPEAVKRAAFVALGIGGLLGVALTALAGAWWMLLVGVAAVLAAWFYTGGSRPYGYLGLGEVFVFVFFGLVAVLGTSYAITLRWSWVALACAAAVGLLAVAVLVANNLRDIPSDTEAGKHTLAVRLGDRRTRLLYAACLVVPFVLLVPVAVHHWPVVLVLLAVPFAVAPVRAVLRGAAGRDLIPVLGATGRVELVLSVLVLAGLVL
ncbi:1,4-dihydroxy-2-naphthoate polyprenyltransferase [Brachybacterium sp. AOP25-B2-12]|uniref:1,4-dihydroxy-2-naphthoate polyprenyltransferase n=1 Tax=Brachybacterium sp. AOP25-B2-12 TaxID=3457710 RepID=UPI00403416E1